MKMTKLKDCCIVIAGQSPNGSSYNEKGEGMEFHQGKKAFGEVYIKLSNIWTTEITKIAESGDILMSVRAPVGPTNLANRKICIGRGLAAIRCTDSVLPKYVFYALRNIEHRIIGNDGAVFNSINKSMIEELFLPLTHLDEQQRIVSYLDSAFAQIDELKAKAEKQLSEAKALYQKALSKAMEPKEGWEEKTLKELSIISGDYGLSVPSKPFDGVRYLRITDITEWGDLNKELVSANIENEAQQEKLEEGDVLFARTGATVGKTLIFKKEFGDCLYAGYLIRYRLNKELILPSFMYYVTHSNKYFEWVMRSQEAAAQPNISAKKYNKLLISYPDLKAQKTIVKHLNELLTNIRKLEVIHHKTISECAALKQSILRQVFE